MGSIAEDMHMSQLSWDHHTLIELVVMGQLLKVAPFTFKNIFV